ncbi:hypothetical protein DASC09_025980 [Saccharomycopsis crataegensis]|uniref:Uncharacterized protein n=1 Tax=Saccharomycopsis crataegensis TaxID=43959 RepID=A0AAV5QKF1_9ASCO|nr:hypothetical protein DASC09_025980 [Saccharomycopsis crataegensis]
MSISPEDAEFTKEILPGLLDEIFPSKINNNTQLYRHIINNEQLNSLPLAVNKNIHFRMLSLVDDGIGNLYRGIKGRGWKLEKLDEFKEEPLVYILYSTSDSLDEDTEINAFISLQFSDLILGDPSLGKVVYLFEIHLSSELQNQSLGTRFLLGIDKLSVSPTLKAHNCKGVELTVFIQNQRAFNWYRKNGYALASDSPPNEEYVILFKQTHSVT